MVDDKRKTRKAAELRLLRRSGEWRVTRPSIRHYDGGGEGSKDLVSSWHNDTVIPVGDHGGHEEQDTTIRVPLPRQGTGSNGWQHLLPSSVSDYFNSEASSLKPDSAQEQAVPSLAGKGHSGVELQTNESSGAPMQALEEAASPEAMILAALEEIPGLDHDDMLKAYRILCYDDSGHRFRSLMGLPMSLRKGFVLLDIKGSEACLICSACSADQHL
ncbi:unnamed protein product [Urochloa humidicola]